MVGARLGKTLGEVMDLTEEEILLWIEFFAMENAKE
jgi:predicted RNase H-like HicB family nuclease